MRNSLTETTNSNCYDLATHLKHIWLYFLRLYFLNKDSKTLFKHITQVPLTTTWHCYVLKIPHLYLYLSFVFNLFTKRNLWKHFYVWRKNIFIFWRNNDSKLVLIIWSIFNLNYNGSCFLLSLILLADS